MGLGIYVGSPAGSLRGLETGGVGGLFGQIEEGIRTILDDPLLERLVSISRHGNGLSVQLHPAEENVDFRVDDDGSLICSAKTSSAGPGYHAMLVDLLTRLQGPCGLSWQWDNEAREFADETAYALNRDFRLLQLEMLKLLRALAQYVTEDPDHTGFALSMPTAYSVVGEHFALSPMGYWSKEWFGRVAASDPEELLAYGEEFFPWWRLDRDALFWRNCGLVKTWMDQPWHPPANEGEAEDCAVTLECFERARTLDRGLPLPEREIDEIRSFLEPTDVPPIPPSPQGVGFRRRLVKRFPYQGWSVTLPGYFYEAEEDEGSTVVFWFGQKTIRMSTMVVRSKDSSPVPAEELASFGKDEIPADAELHQVTETDRVGWAVITPERDENQQPFWMLQGNMAVPGHVGHITVCYSDPADEMWAIETWRSVQGPSASEEDEANDE